MKIYIEFAILNNFFINFLICYLSVLSVKKSFIIWRTLLADLIGTAFALAYPFMNFSGLLILKILLSIIMVALLCKKLVIKEFLQLFMNFYLYTFLIGGVAIGLNYLIKGRLSFDLDNSLMPFYLSFSCLIVIVAGKKIHKELSKKRRSKFEVKVLLENGGKSFYLSGLIDSGNKLYYRDYLPVNIISSKILNDLNMKEKGEITVNTANGSSNMKLYKADKMTLFEEDKKSVYSDIAVVSSENLKDKYQMIINCEFC